MPTVRRTEKRRAEDPLRHIERDTVRCELCPRLRRHCQEVAVRKRRAYLDWDYWGRPVPGFGDPQARLWVVGLAPAAHGANRTGRVFTGDSSGDWLFRALHDHGFASIPTSTSRDDGQRLHDAYISAVVRCAPPENKPRPLELRRCARYFERELRALVDLRVLVPLGRIAFDSVLRLLESNGYELERPRPRFAHAARILVRPQEPSKGRRPLSLVVSYHPSRQNTQTGKLTRPMLDRVFATARRILDHGPEA